MSAKLSFAMIYDLQTTLYSQLNQLLAKHKLLYTPSSSNEINIDGQENLLNNISVLNHLIASTKDLKMAFGVLRNSASNSYTTLPLLLAVELPLCGVSLTAPWLPSCKKCK